MGQIIILCSYNISKVIKQPKAEFILETQLQCIMTAANESTPLNKLAVADAAWARMPVDSLNMTLA